MKAKRAILIDPYKSEVTEIFLNEPGEPDNSIRKALGGKHFAIFHMFPNEDILYVGDEMRMREDKHARFWEFPWSSHSAVGYGIVVGKEDPMLALLPGEDYLTDALSSIDYIKRNLIFVRKER